MGNYNKITEAQYMDIRRKDAMWTGSTKELANMLGINESTLRKIRQYYPWSNYEEYNYRHAENQRLHKAKAPEPEPTQAPEFTDNESDAVDYEKLGETIRGAIREEVKLMLDSGSVRNIVHQIIKDAVKAGMREYIEDMRKGAK